MSRIKFGLVLVITLLSPFSSTVRASTIFSSNGGDYDACFDQFRCSWMSGVGTNTVQMLVAASSDSSIGRTDVFFSRTFSFYTQGPVTPGTLTLNSFLDYDGGGVAGGNGAGTVWDLETGSPVAIFTWSINRGVGVGTWGGGPVLIPLNVGVPFSITINTEATAQTVNGYPGSGNAALMAQISINPIPEPVSGLLFVSGLAAMAWRWTRRKC